MRRVFSLLAIAGGLLALAQIGLSTPALAQSSCMHCNFALAKCKQFNPNDTGKCTAEKATCVKKCQMTKGSAAGTADKAKSADTVKPTK